MIATNWQKAIVALFEGLIKADRHFCSALIATTAGRKSLNGHLKRELVYKWGPEKRCFEAGGRFVACSKLPGIKMLITPSEPPLEWL